MNTKRIVIILVLILSIFGSLKIINGLIRDQIIQEESKKVYDINKDCAGLIGKYKRLCYKDVNLKKDDLPKNYYYFDSKTKNKVKLDASFENETGFIVIDRTPFLRLGGGNCLFTSRVFEFDEYKIYISQDNEAGFFYCKDGIDYIMIYPENINESYILNEIKRIGNF